MAKIDDDSLLGAFKEVGDEFKDAGRDIASAFGIKFNKKNEENNKDDYDVIEISEFNYKPESDEIIILAYPNVYVFGDINDETCALMLTNKRIVVEYTTGIIKTQAHINTYNLSDIKSYQDETQIKLGKYDGGPVLDVYFVNAHLLFSFCEIGREKKQIACINKWITKMNEAIKKSNQEEYCEEDQEEDLCETNENYKCKKCGSEVESGLKFCTECGSPVETPASPSGKSTHKQVSNNHQKGTETNKDKLSVEEQIELLQKLKSLVDNGVLSQEEFEQKKKEIL